MSTLVINDLHVSIDGKEILKGVDLTINSKEIHALMGPNGNGKSTLLAAIMGHPKYTVTRGEVTLDGQNVLEMDVDQRSKAGLFLGMQYPQEVTGVTNSDFLKAALNARREKPIGLFAFIKEMEGAIAKLEMKSDLAHRYVNEGFSGGEKKRNEILQMMLLKPRLAMLDEIDSGLDVDAMKIVAGAILDEYEKRELGLVIVSHYDRFYQLIKPTHSHILIDGKIVMSGDDTLAKKIDEEGYDWLQTQLGVVIVPEEEVKAPVRVSVSLGTCAVNERAKNE
ncbi:MAG: Fe-S cluster assembly ATPase SufC [Firmicutes bacterium GWF2_51_9]|nr:MAG: Fe-S cluster assembly ATPase SufC [Firmicutes bacterium GWF2_51_9]OGS58233.1 MAG: Fe-S cluster assembly ATPase SufC [Firmicutes bacterium GWE2_51_13]HAM64206.1 Fe-S cluster assembly ATPase SufC [Erysipelotrichaceae bacterium]HBZ42271.1 Fe-S cluster assembly ATPase SufC [Erysipelotrichaceae bacterium]